MFDGRFGTLKPARHLASACVSAMQLSRSFSPEDGVAKYVLQRLDNAKSSIRFMTFSYTSDEIADAMIDKKEAGLVVQGVFDRQSANGTGAEFQKLQSSGIDVLIDGNCYICTTKQSSSTSAPSSPDHIASPAVPSATTMKTWSSSTTRRLRAPISTSSTGRMRRRKRRLAAVNACSRVLAGALAREPGKYRTDHGSLSLDWLTILTKRAKATTIGLRTLLSAAPFTFGLRRRRRG